MGFGRILGGALEGAGTGVAQMAELREVERRAVALENLRSQNQRVEMNAQADLQDRNAARSEGRRLNSALIIGDQEGRQAAAANKAKIEATAAEKEAERQHDIRMEKLRGVETRLTEQAKAAIENNQVADTRVADNGEYLIITKGGKTIRSGYTATEKERIYNPNTGTSEDGDVLSQVRGGAAPAASKPPPQSAKSPAKASTPKTYEPPFIDGAYRIMLDKDAEAFVNNPANKGKKFVGPDGGTYIVK